MEHLKQALVFLVGQNRYAMDILDLKEVCRMPRVESASGSGGGMLGIIHMHGQPVEVFDMARLLGDLQSDVCTLPSDGLSRRWIVVGHTPGGATHWRVDKVEDIIEINPDQVVPSDGVDTPDVLDLDGGVAHLLTPEFLCARLAT